MHKRALEEKENCSPNKKTIQIFNPEDTKHLDIRLEQTKSPSLFKIETLLALNASDMPNNCLGFGAGKFFGLLLNNEIHLLNSSLSQHQATLQLDALPECFHFNQDGSFMVVGDESGTLHFIHCQTQTVLFSQHIHDSLKPQKTFARLLFRYRNAPKEELFVLLTNMKLYRFSNFDFVKLKEALSAGNRDLALAVKSDIQVETVHLSDFNYISDFSLFQSRPGQPSSFVCSGEKRISFWKVCDEGTTEMEDFSTNISIDIEKCQSTHDGRFFLTLDKESNLGFWDRTFMLQMYNFPNRNISEFMIVKRLPESLGVKSKDQVLILALTKEEPKHLTLILLPEWKEIYSVPVSDLTFILQSDDDMTDFYLLFAEYKNGQVYVQKWQQSEPYQRFHELLEKSKFEEAIHIAEEYDLPIEELYKKKSKYLLEQPEVDFEQLSDILNKIQDNGFVLDLCLNTNLSSINDIQALMKLANDRIYKSKTQNLLLAAEFYRLLKKFGTFQILNPHGKVNSWLQFKECDLTSYIKLKMSEGDFNCVKLIWKRHGKEIESSIWDLLALMPEDLELNSLLAWIQSDILQLIKTIEEKTTFANWIEKRAKYIERKEKNPKNALLLCSLLDDTKQGKLNQSELLTPFQFVNYTEKMAQTGGKNGADFGFKQTQAYKDLSKFIKELEDIQYLIDHHDFYISHQEYSKTLEPESSICFKLLDRVQSEEILPIAIEDDLKPYLERHKQLNMDEILHEYAMHLLQSTSATFCEPKVLCLIEKIEQNELKYDVILNMLQRCKIPWSNEIQALMNQLKESNREDINDQIRLMELKKILIAYGIHTPFSKGDVKLVKTFLKKILSQIDIETSLQDALKVASAFPNVQKRELYLFRLQVLCQQKQYEYINEFIELIPKDIRSFVCLEMQTRLEISLQKNYEQNLTALVEVLRFSEQEETNYQSCLKMLHLWKEFGIKTDLKSFEDADYKQNIFKEFLMSQTDLKLLRKSIRVQRLMELLDISKTQFEFMLAQNYWQQGDFKTSFQRLYLLVESHLKENDSSFVSQLKQSLMQALLFVVENPQYEWRTLSSDLVQICRRLMQHPNLSGKEIGTILDMFKCFEFYNVLYEQSCSGAYQNAIELNETGKETEPTKILFKNQFEEQGLVLKTKEVSGYSLEFILKFLQKPEQSFDLKSKGASNEYQPEAFLNYLKANRTFQSVLRLFQQYQEYDKRFSDRNYTEEEEPIISAYYESLMQLIQKTLSASKETIDASLSFGYMLSLPQKLAFDCLKKSLSGVHEEFERIEQMASIGLGASTVWQQRTFTVQLETLALNARWWSQFKLLDMQFEEEQFRLHEPYRLSMIPQLMRRTNLDIFLCLQYANDYHLEQDSCYLEYIQQTILNNKEENFPFVLGLLKEVANQQKLIEMLQQTLSDFDPFQYRSIRFLFQLILNLMPEDEIAKKGIFILDILEKYETAYEEKIPYHTLLLDSWTVIESRLTVDNLPLLLSLAQPLDLESDQFYVIVIKKILSVLNDKQSVKFLDLKQLLVKVKNHEVAIGTWLLVADYFPIGPQRIQALKMAQFTFDKMTGSRNTRVLTRDHESLGLKIRNLLTKAEIQNDLWQNDFKDQKVLEMWHHPADLIKYLYQNFSLDPTSDLNEMCQLIAEKSQLVYLDLINEIYSEWIRSPSSKSTETGQLLSSQRIFGLNSDEWLLQKKLVYLLKGWQNEIEVVNLLLKTAYDASQKVTTTVRVRCLSVLLQFASPDLIETVHSIKEVLHYLKILYYLADCEDLKISIRTRELYKLEKDAFAQSLFLHRSNEPKIILFIVNLLIDFQLYADLKLWQNVLEAMQRFGLYEEQLRVLLLIDHVPELNALQSLPHLWQESINYLIESGDERIFSLLLKSPFLSLMDLNQLWSELKGSEFSGKSEEKEDLINLLLSRE